MLMLSGSPSLAQARAPFLSLHTSAFTHFLCFAHLPSVLPSLTALTPFNFFSLPLLELPSYPSFFLSLTLFVPLPFCLTLQIFRFLVPSFLSYLLSIFLLMLHAPVFPLQIEPSRLTQLSRSRSRHPLAFFLILSTSKTFVLVSRSSPHTLNAFCYTLLLTPSSAQPESLFLPHTSPFCYAPRALHVCVFLKLCGCLSVWV